MTTAIEAIPGSVLSQLPPGQMPEPGTPALVQDPHLTVIMPLNQGAGAGVVNYAPGRGLETGDADHPASCWERYGLDMARIGAIDNSIYAARPVVSASARGISCAGWVHCWRQAVATGYLGLFAVGASNPSPGSNNNRFAFGVFGRPSDTVVRLRLDTAQTDGTLEGQLFNDHPDMLDRWAFVGGTIRPGRRRSYVNGRIIAEDAPTMGYQAVTDQRMLWATGGIPWRIGSLKVWDREISADEMMVQYRDEWAEFREGAALVGV